MITRAKNHSAPVLAGAITLGTFVLTACAASTPPPAEPEPEAAPEAPAAPEEPEPEPPPPEPAAKLAFHLEGAGLAHPESVIHDAEQDIYFVSSVNGDPAAADKNGFISKVSPDGTVLELKFIDGSKPQTLLNAPKGLAIAGDVLYVADLNTVRSFNKKTGALRGAFPAAGATFLNAVTVDASGLVLVTDSGWKSDPAGFANTGTDAVLKLDPKKGKISSLLKDTSLGNPNGILATGGSTFVVNWAGELFDLTPDGKKGVPTKLPKAFLDGVVALEDGSFLVSSWEGGAVYHGEPGGEFTAVVVDLPSPAAIGYDAKRDRLLVPSMMDDRLLGFDLTLTDDAPPLAAPAAKPAPAPATEPAKP